MKKVKNNTISSLTVVYNERFYIEMLLEGVKQWADEIVIVDGFSTDGTWEYLQEQAKLDKRIKIKQSKHLTPETYHFGKGRQVAYDMSTSDWVFWIDADEALQDNVKELLQRLTFSGADFFDVQYVHFVYHFGQVDASEPVHIGIARFHKRYDDVNLDYRKNHTLPLSQKFKTKGFATSVIIFHCGYLNGMQKVCERYIRNVEGSEIHSPVYQTYWKEWHYSGTYPTKPFDYNLCPTAIKNRFRIGESKIGRKLI